VPKPKITKAERLVAEADHPKRWHDIGKLPEFKA
jgi:hypothetical protein